MNLDFKANNKATIFKKRRKSSMTWKLTVNLRKYIPYLQSIKNGTRLKQGMPLFLPALLTTTLKKIYKI
jgi:hypothetical protein